MTITKVKSRYCVKCDALYKYECVCPNNVRMRNIKKTFQKISLEKIKTALEEVGLHGEENEII
jgi:hypothetical protein|tara:strand:+ start:97 stop:285 length:189 start_codon:yes stop_codon:yes gene_type:complete